MYKETDGFDSNLSGASFAASNNYPPHENPFDYMPGHELKPKYLADSVGQYLVYPGEIHLFYGKPQTLKSWVLLGLLGTCDVRYMDFENGRLPLKDRLTRLGIDKKDASVFCFPETIDEIRTRFEEYLVTRPDVICIDGLPDLFGHLGKDGDNNKDAEDVFNMFLKPLTAVGIAVIALDHLPKSATEGNDDYPIGAQKKKGTPSVLYLHRANKESDSVDFFVVKDRHNQVSSRCEGYGYPKYYGSIKLDKGDGILDPSVHPIRTPFLDGIEYEAEDAYRMIKVWNACRDNPGITQTQLDSEVKGNHQLRKEATENLKELGYLEIKRKGNALAHTVIGDLQFEWRTKGSAPGF